MTHSKMEDRQMKKLFVVLVALLALGFLAGCIGPKGDNPADKRQVVQTMKQETLKDLYTFHPKAEKSVTNSIGYAVFSNIGINLLIISTGNGWGVAHDNATGKETYMKMFSAGVGIGVGVKDFRGVFLFSTKDAFDSFVEEGWQAGAQADAAAKTGEKGGAADSAIDVAPGVELYQLTKNGLALQATIQGTRYWKDEELNTDN
jgi:lipid-binding SYLF domain-containing protein